MSEVIENLLDIEQQPSPEVSRWVEVLGVERGKDGRKYFRAICSCGTEKVVRADHFGTRCKSCGCLQKESAAKIGRENGYEDSGRSTMNIILSRYQRGARQRGLSFTLSEDSFLSMLRLPCHYCGSAPENRYQSSPRINPDGERFSGVDRIRNDLGYEEGNCVPCCFTCNRAKSTLGSEEFYSWILRVVNHRHPSDETIEVLPPHGFVRLVRWQGSEKDIINAARVSFHKEIYALNLPDVGLLKYLVKNRHGTPFEQGFMAMFHIRLPIFVMREWIRHRVGFSYNEESGRYVQLRPDFYIPDEWRTQKGKPGAYTFEGFESDEATSSLEAWSLSAYREYEKLLSLGVAKEMARLVLPVNLFTEMRWTVNARSLMNFLALRNSPHALTEIRKYAEVTERLFMKHMPNVGEAFLENERMAP